MMTAWHGDHLRLFHQVASEVGITYRSTFRNVLADVMHGYNNLYVQQNPYGYAEANLNWKVCRAIEEGDFEAMLAEDAFYLHGHGFNFDLSREELPDDPDFPKQYVLTLLHANGCRRSPTAKMAYARTVLATAGIMLPREDELPSDAGFESTLAIQRVLEQPDLLVDYPMKVVPWYWRDYILPDWLEQVVAGNFAISQPGWAKLLPRWMRLAMGKEFTLPLLNLRHEGSRTVLVQ